LFKQSEIIIFLTTVPQTTTYSRIKL